MYFEGSDTVSSSDSRVKEQIASFYWFIYRLIDVFVHSSVSFTDLFLLMCICKKTYCITFQSELLMGNSCFSGEILVT